MQRNDHESVYAPLVAQPIPEAPRRTSSAARDNGGGGWGSFPGSRRPAAMSRAPAPDHVFIKTGGNSLQAVSRETAQDDGLLAVSVPIGVKPGHKILVAVPGESERLIEAIVPTGVFEGHTFLVRIPPLGEAPPQATLLTPYEGGEIPTAHAHLAPPEPQTVAGHDLENLRLAEVLVDDPAPHTPTHPNTSGPFSQALETSARAPSNSNTGTTNSPAAATPRGESHSDLVLVRVPPGSLPGSAIRIRIDDGRLIEAVVPDGNVNEFFLRVPPVEGATNRQQQSNSSSQSQRQNWHNHPLAIAPMAIGPFL